jgi:hypothetical protein
MVCTMGPNTEATIHLFPQDMYGRTPVDVAATSPGNDAHIMVERLQREARLRHDEGYGSATRSIQVG